MLASASTRSGLDVQPRSQHGGQRRAGSDRQPRHLQTRPQRMPADQDHQDARGDWVDPALDRHRRQRQQVGDEQRHRQPAEDVGRRDVAHNRIPHQRQPDQHPSPQGDRAHVASPSAPPSTPRRCTGRGRDLGGGPLANRRRSVRPPPSAPGRRRSGNVGISMPAGMRQTSSRSAGDVEETRVVLQQRDGAASATSPSGASAQTARTPSSRRSTYSVGRLVSTEPATRAKASTAALRADLQQCHLTGKKRRNTTRLSAGTANTKCQHRAGRRQTAGDATGVDALAGLPLDGTTTRNRVVCDDVMGDVVDRAGHPEPAGQGHPNTMLSRCG